MTGHHAPTDDWKVGFCACTKKKKKSSDKNENDLCFVRLDIVPPHALWSRGPCKQCVIYRSLGLFRLPVGNVHGRELSFRLSLVVRTTTTTTTKTRERALKEDMPFIQPL